MSKSISPNAPCPCMSGKKYKKCCRTYHNGRSVPEPELLVRARFSAYSLGKVEYIMQTTHSDSPHYEGNDERWLFDLRSYMTQTQFTDLTILETSDNSVSYRVELMYADKPMQYIEHSNFAQVEGNWLFVDSKMTEL